jgi:hypothetical protein
MARHISSQPHRRFFTKFAHTLYIALCYGATMAHMPNQHVVINEFKDESRPGSTWRLNWFGGIERDPDVATEYKLQVVLTLVKEHAYIEWHTEAAVEQDILRMIRIGVGQLPLLRIGSLWRDGKLIRLRTGVEQRFFLNIPMGIPNFYTATDKVGRLAGLIPFRDHRLMAYGKNTKCIVLPHEDDQAGIIIPVIELIRFYYASSTRLSKAVFDGDFIHAPTSIYDPEYTGMNGELAVVCRRQDVSDDDCWTIARILNSQDAFDGARRVNDSMIRSFANSSEAHPESRFPFSGPTRLKALCKQVGYAPTRWLVLSIVSCSGFFPYNELQVIADNDGRQADPETDIVGENKIPIARPSDKRGDESDPVTLQSGKEPDKQALPKRLELSGDCFTALLGKKILKLEKDRCNYKSGQLQTLVESPPSAHGTGDGDNTNPGVGKIEITKPNSEALPPSYELLIALIGELNTRESVIARLLPLPCGPGLIKARLTAPAGRRQWAYINHQKRQIRFFMIIEVRTSTGYYYLVEIERRTFSSSDKYCAEIYYNSQRTSVSAHHIEALSIALSRQNGRISNTDEINRIGLYKSPNGLRHTDIEIGRYANRVLAEIERENCLTSIPRV